MKRIRPLLLLLVVIFLVACSDADSTSPATENATTPTPAIASPAWIDDLLSEPLSLPSDADFTLTDTNGQPFTLSQQTDKITVLYFGFTSCPDVCPLTLHDLSRAFVDLDQPSDDLQVVFVTIDPERDTPDLMSMYVGRYNENFIALTGDSAALQTAYDVFGVWAEKVDLPTSALGYTMDHSADVYIIPPDRRFSRRFQHGATFSNFAHDFGVMIDHLDALRPSRTVAYADQLHSVAQDRLTPLADFTLTSTRDGAAFTLSQQRDQITLLYYGFTSCPDICPLTLYEISRALEALGPLADSIQVGMVTVDPDRDNPTLLKNYVERYDDRFIGLYGDEAATEAAKAVFNVLAIKQPLEGSAMGYTIDHTADIFVIGPQGQYITRIPHGTPYTDMADDLRIIIAQENIEPE